MRRRLCACASLVFLAIVAAAQQEPAAGSGPVAGRRVPPE